MQKIEYIVVGLGIAGISICERLEAEGKSFVVFSDTKNVATKTAGGVVNPVVLKRFNPVWKAEEFLKEAQPFYKNLSKKLDSPFIKETEVLRIFNSAEEQNDWIVASDKASLSKYLSPKILQNRNPNINAPLGFGKVESTLVVNTNLLLERYRNYLLQKGKLVAETFNYGLLKFEGADIHYKQHISKKIIFCEGVGAVKNPFFSKNMLLPKKGEYVTIKAPQLQLESVLKGSFFIIPQGDDEYKIGATFAHGDLAKTLTEKGKSQIVNAAEKIIKIPFQVVNQEVGFRPTVKDRRPILGSLLQENVLFYNGLGTRGLLMSPLLSKWLFDFSERKKPLPTEVDIERF